MIFKLSALKRRYDGFGLIFFKALSNVINFRENWRKYISTSLKVNEFYICAL